MSPILFTLFTSLCLASFLLAEHCSFESGTVRAYNYTSLASLRSRCLHPIRDHPRYAHNRLLGVYLFNISLGHLPSDAFNGLRVRKLLLSDCRLTGLAPNVLGNTTTSITQVIMRTTSSVCPKLDKSLLRTIRSWSRLELLELCLTSSAVLPGGAFHQLDSLHTLKLYGHGQTSLTIKTNAFARLESLRLLIVHRIGLVRVEDGAFMFNSFNVSLMFIQCHTNLSRDFGPNTIVPRNNKTAVDVFFNSDKSIPGASLECFKQLLLRSSRSKLYINNVVCDSLQPQHWVHKMMESKQIRLKCSETQRSSTRKPRISQSISLNQIYSVLRKNGFRNYESINAKLRHDMVKSFRLIIRNVQPEVCLLEHTKCSRMLRVLDELSFLDDVQNETLLANVTLIRLEQSRNYRAIINRIHFIETIDSTSKTMINSDIVSINVIHKETRKRETNASVKIVFENGMERHYSDRVRCVFWDFRFETWSTDGCWFEWRESTSNTTVCHCAHLTNFAALLDVSGREDNDRIKSVLTCVFCSLSVLCFLVSICLSYRMARVEKFTLANDQFRWKSNKYVINLNIAFCLLITNLLTVAGLDRREVRAVCLSISITLVFFLLSSFSFMLLQGYHLLRSTLKPLLNDFRFRSYFLIGYGMPTLILLISVAIVWFKDRVFLDLFIGDFFCWISGKRNPFYMLIIVVPITVSIMVNVIFYLLLLRSICRRNHMLAKLGSIHSGSTRSLQSQVSYDARRQRSSLVLLAFNLGINWATYLLYAAEETHYFAYLFIVLNGSQGLFFLISQLLTFNSKKAH